MHILPFDPNWKNSFAEEKQKLAAIFRDLKVGIHHVGSTAIQTTRAKPEIDILLVIKDDKALAQ